MTRRLLLRLALAAAFVPLLWETLYVTAGRNQHEVIPGRVYRCAQPGEAAVADLARNYGIRTVVNLRGFCDPHVWYAAECRATAAAGLSQEDVTLSASRLPPPGELRRLVEILDRSEYPIALHCRRGSDRTGLAAALALLLQTDASPAAARKQCALRYGHTGVGPAAAMDRFFELYDEYLAEKGVPHSAEVVRRFVATDYCPDGSRASLQWACDLSPRRAGEPWNLRVTATNTSIRAWEFKPGRRTGVSAVFTLVRPDTGEVTLGHAGLFRRVVPPGASVTLTLPVAPPAAPGVYVIRVDLAADGATTFAQLGGEPLEAALLVNP